MSKYKPFINIGIGEYIKEELEERGWTQKDLAEILGLSEKFISDLINNKKEISAQLAKLLSNALGASPQYWLNLDFNYRLREQENLEKEKIVKCKSEIYSRMPINDLIKKGWIEKTNSKEGLIQQVTRLLGVDKLDFSEFDKRKQEIVANFRRKRTNTQFNPFYAQTWLYIAHNSAKNFDVPNFEKKNLERIFENLYKYTSENNIPKFIELLIQSGVKFFVLEHLPKTYLDGASFMDNENPVIIYTGRYDRLDNFWFTIAHEIAHILLHSEDKNFVFLDDLSDIGGEKEQEADLYASKMLRINEILDRFEDYHYIKSDLIYDCAEELNVHPAVVLGAVQFSKNNYRSKLNHIKSKVTSVIPTKYFAGNML